MSKYDALLWRSWLLKVFKTLHINVVICLCLSLFLQHCAFSSFNRRGDRPEDYYQEGEENTKRKLWLDAESAFIQLRNKHPYSKYAILADLRLADVKYKSERYLEAREAYKLFMQAHPHHEQVPYAQYMMAMTHYQEMPSDFFVFPPSHEKDDTEARRAIEAFKDYLTRYPQGKDADDAQKKLTLCEERLIAHDLYVARFYRRIKKYKGALGRYQAVYERRLALGTLNKELMLEIAETYEADKDQEKAFQCRCELHQRFPQFKEAFKQSAALSRCENGENGAASLPVSVPASSLPAHRSSD